MTDHETITILNEAHRVWAGIDRGTHTASDLDRVLDPRRWAAHAPRAEVSAFGPIGDEPVLNLGEGWVRDLQSIYSAAQCSTPGVTRGPSSYVKVDEDAAKHLGIKPGRYELPDPPRPDWIEAEAHTPADAPTQAVPALEVEGDAPSRVTPTDDERDAAWLRFARAEGYGVSDWTSSVAFDGGWKARSEAAAPRAERIEAVWDNGEHDAYREEDEG